MNRSRPLYILLMAATFACGISSRIYASHLPEFIAVYAGDTLWALMVFWALGFIFKSESTVVIAAGALTLSFVVELTQLYHSPYIDSVRSTLIGGLLLGYTFIWSDLVCYTAGVLIGILFEKLFYTIQ